MKKKNVSETSCQSQQLQISWRQPTSFLNIRNNLPSKYLKIYRSEGHSGDADTQCEVQTPSLYSGLIIPGLRNLCLLCELMYFDSVIPFSYWSQTTEKHEDFLSVSLLQEISRFSCQFFLRSTVYYLSKDITRRKIFHTSPLLDMLQH